MPKLLIKVADLTRTVSFEETEAVLPAMLAARPGAVPSFETVPDAPASTPNAAIVLNSQDLNATTGEDCSKIAPAPTYSVSFKESTVDADAKARIEAQHAALIASGTVKASDVGHHNGTGPQFFANGTRMMREGYDTQEARKREFLALRPAHDVISDLSGVIASEKREDVTVSAKDLGNAIEANGKIRAFGLALSEQAIRGMLARVDSPALGYVLGMRERIAGEVSKGDAKDSDRIKRLTARIAEILRTECQENPDTRLVLRTRKGLGDVFAVVSESYGKADPDEVLSRLAFDLPDDARATFSYDAASTAWEVRASVWTPTDVAKQAVGEAFEGYAAFRGKDNGTGSVSGGGGAFFLRCLNASVYSAGEEMSRVHRGKRTAIDVVRVLSNATKAIDALCSAWGVARKRILDTGAVPLNEAIPGFYRALLTRRESEFANVLPGRSETHVARLAATYEDERRNEDAVTLSDVVNGWTRYAQAFPMSVQRNAEEAAGAFLARSPSKLDMVIKAS